MTRKDDAVRNEILARLAQSRAEIQQVLDPPPEASSEAGSTPSRAKGTFPRSRTMQLLLSNRGLVAAGALVGGLLLARPRLAWRLIRLLPTRALARSFLLRAFSTMRAKSGE